MLKRPFQIILLLLVSITSYGQSDTLYLVGNSRLYADGIALRWNATSALGYYQISKGTIVIQQRKGADSPFETIKEQTLLPIENWGLDGKKQDDPKLVTAASIFNLHKVLASPQTDFAKQLEQRETINFLWANVVLNADLNAEIAQNSNLGYKITGSQSGEMTEFRVFVKSENTISDTLEFFIYNDFFQPENMSNFYATEHEGYVSFTIPTNKKYTAYCIERSKKGENSFTKLNAAPLVVPNVKGSNNNISFTDSVKNYVPYDYRIYAIDLFGDKSNYSTLLTAQGRDETPPPPISGLKVMEVENKKLKISWDAYEALNGEKGIAVGLKHDPHDVYKPLNEVVLPLGQTEFVFPIIDGETNYHFNVQIFDTAGNSSSTQIFYQLEDNTPPSKPENLKASVSKNGVVTLIWDWNEEADLDGYLVYFSNNINAEFSGIQNTALFDTIFKDTLPLNMLNRDVFYFVVAVDRRFNPSEKSDIVKALRPDTLAPVAPVIVNYEVTDSVISIFWNRSTSADVATQVLYKQPRGSSTSQPIIISRYDSIYRDKEVSHQLEYEYFLQVADSSDNVSESSNMVSLKPYKNYFRPAVSIFVVRYDSIKNEAELRWEYDQKGIEKVQIFRGKTYATVSHLPVKVDPLSTSFTDNKMIKGQNYYYAIQLFFTDGTRTRMSSIIGF